MIGVHKYNILCSVEVSDEGGGDNTGVIFGVVIGVIVTVPIIVIIIIALFCYIKKKKGKLFLVHWCFYNV